MPEFVGKTEKFRGWGREADGDMFWRWESCANRGGKGGQGECRRGRMALPHTQLLRCEGDDK